METADSKKQSAEVLLHALSMVGSDAWCFAPIDQDSLTHCSRSFMTMWGFDLPTPDQAGEAISLQDTRIGDRLEALGFERHWLSYVLKSSGAFCDDLPEDCYICKVRRVVVPDDDGRPAGVLLMCRNSYERFVSPDDYSRAVESQTRVDRLSPRETEIMGLVFDGFTNKAIASKAGISEKTVEKHRANIMRKLGVRSIAELIRRVAEVRLIISDGPEPRNSLECS